MKKVLPRMSNAQGGELTNSLSWVSFYPPKPGQDARAGTIIGEVACHCCGAPSNVKLDMNLKAYVYCNSHHPDNIDPCGSSLKWNRAASQKLISAWSKSKPSESPVAQSKVQSNVDQTVDSTNPPAEPATRTPRAPGPKNAKPKVRTGERGTVAPRVERQSSGLAWDLGGD